MLSWQQFQIVCHVIAIIIINRNLCRAVSMKIFNCALHKKLIKDGKYNPNFIAKIPN